MLSLLLIAESLKLSRVPVPSLDNITFLLSICVVELKLTLRDSRRDDIVEKTSCEELVDLGMHTLHCVGRNAPGACDFLLASLRNVITTI